MGTRSVVTTLTKDYTPSDLMNQSSLLYRLLEEIRVHEANRVLTGGLVGDPTTPSAQLTGTGNTLWNINVSALLATVNGVIKEAVAAVDTAIHSGSYLTGFSSGKACIAAVVLKNVSGTVSLATIKGTVATAGSEVAPTDAEIQAAVGSGNAWVKLCEDRLERTGDTTVAQTHNNTVRPVLGINAGFELDL